MRTYTQLQADFMKNVARALYVRFEIPDNKIYPFEIDWNKLADNVLVSYAVDAKELDMAQEYHEIVEMYNKFAR